MKDVHSRTLVLFSFLIERILDFNTIDGTIDFYGRPKIVSCFSLNLLIFDVGTRLLVLIDRVVSISSSVLFFFLWRYWIGWLFELLLCLDLQKRRFDVYKNCYCVSRILVRLILLIDNLVFFEPLQFQPQRVALLEHKNINVCVCNDSTTPVRRFFAGFIF